MIEMLGVLAIVGVLSVGGIAGYSKAMEKFKINKTIDEISHIVANIRTLYAQQTTYEGLDETNAIKMGVIPDSLKTSNSWPTMINSFNGVVLIYQHHSGQRYFGISYNGLSKDACMSLATYNWGDKSSSGLIGITLANYNGVTDGFRVVDEYGFIMSKGCFDASSFLGSKVCIGEVMPVSHAAQICNGCDATDGCGIAWTYQ